MSTLPQVEGVEPIEGESTRCFVRSDTKADIQYLVDLSEFDGNSACDCQHFQMRLAPKLAQGERDWTPARKYQCKHIIAAWAVMGPRLAKMVDSNP